MISRNGIYLKQGYVDDQLTIAADITSDKLRTFSKLLTLLDTPEYISYLQMEHDQSELHAKLVAQNLKHDLYHAARKLIDLADAVQSNDLKARAKSRAWLESIADYALIGHLALNTLYAYHLRPREEAVIISKEIDMISNTARQALQSTDVLSMIDFVMDLVEFARFTRQKPPAIINELLDKSKELALKNQDLLALATQAQVSRQFQLQLGSIDALLDQAIALFEESAGVKIKKERHLAFGKLIIALKNDTARLLSVYKTAAAEPDFCSAENFFDFGQTLEAQLITAQNIDIKTRQAKLNYILSFYTKSAQLGNVTAIPAAMRIYIAKLTPGLDAIFNDCIARIASEHDDSKIKHILRAESFNLTSFLLQQDLLSKAQIRDYLEKDTISIKQEINYVIGNMLSNPEQCAKLKKIMSKKSYSDDEVIKNCRISTCL